jgi:hypothetical protein
VTPTSLFAPDHTHIVSRATLPALLWELWSMLWLLTKDIGQTFCVRIVQSVQMAGFPAPKSVITSLAGFAARRPQPPGERTAIPAAFRY